MQHDEATGAAFGRTHAGAVAIMLGVAVVSGAPALAQAQGTLAINGVVVDSATGVGIALADLSLDGSTARAQSNERGVFRLSAEGNGPYVLHVRRLGFLPRVLSLSAAQAGATVTVRLAPSTRSLDAVQVRAARTKYTGRLAGYYSRLERRTQGQFITRDDLEREHPAQLTDMLQRQPGLRITRGRPSAQSVRMRGRDCRPLIWLDGTAMPSGDVDLDSFSPESLEGIEIYLGSTPPAGFLAARGQSECGTILLWSRDTQPRPRGHAATPEELEELLASLSVFTAGEVETPAALDTAVGWVVSYPPSLRASGTSGTVVAEFVVDTTGRVEESHLGIVSSTNALFSAAVRESAGAARFSPAIRGGRRVRQLVRLPFDFRPGSGNQ